jgi:hypothetical protein
MNTLSIPAPKQPWQQLWMAFILVAALFFGAFQPAMTVHADEGYAYYWSLTFDFENGGNGRLYVAVGYNDNGNVQEPPIYAQNFNVPCSRVGNVGVSGGTLKLNGGYLACDLDIQQALATAFALCSERVKGCHMNIQEYEPYANFQAEAIVRSVTPGAAPIFYHQDASYSINPQSSMTQITASVSPHGSIPSMALPAFPVLNTWQNYSAVYECGGVCQMQYTTAGGVQAVNTANAKISFFTPATTLYIGHNPATVTTAPAGTEVDFLFIDPPNHGNH